MKMPYTSTLFAQKMKELGYHPFPLPSGNLSQAYVNPLGIRMGQCSYCGFCERFGCGNHFKDTGQSPLLTGSAKNAHLAPRAQLDASAYEECSPVAGSGAEHGIVAERRSRA